MSAPELVAGYVVSGKYTIRSLLLHGGAMATYRAVGAKNREVAVKLYDPAILSFPDVLKVLALHRSVGAKMPPEQVLPIAESGTDSNSGAPFTVTEFESAPSLARLVDRGPLSATQMVALVHSLAGVTDLLHANGVGHLSLHPGNVFVRPGAQPEVRIADFGASLVRNAIPVPEKAGRWMPWLAPEQIKAQVPPTHSADTFAVALLAFFAVTGKPYWRSSQMKAPDTAALRREILGERMPASVRAREFSITLNPAVDHVFARALAFRPTDRHGTAREFAVALDAAISGRSVAEVDAARPPSANLASANVASATAKASGTEPNVNRTSSPDDGAPSGRRMAPPPRKMPQRTMLGMGSLDDADDVTIARPRLPLTTMLGIGENAAEAPAAAPAPSATATPSAKTSEPMQTAQAKPNVSAVATAQVKNAVPATAAAPAKVSPPAMPTATAKVSPPAMPTAAAKASPPAMPTAAAKASPPAMPTAAAKVSPPAMPPTTAKASPPAMPTATAVFATPIVAVAPATSAAPVLPAAAAISAAAAMPPAPAVSAELPKVVLQGTNTQRGAPPALPMTPPPAQLEEVLAKFEALPNPLAAAAFSAPSSAGTDVAKAAPVWSTAEHRDSGAERVETGVAVIGADSNDRPKTSRMRWIASICGLLVLTGGAAWAVSGARGESHGHAAPDAKVTAAAPTTVTDPSPVPAAPPAAAVQPQAEDPVQPVAEEPRAAAPIEPAAPPSPPAAEEPAAAEPAAPVADTNAAPRPATAQRSAPSPTWAPPPAAAAPRSLPSSKPCGKFLKRCK